MTPLAVSIAGAIASFTLVLIVLELIRSHRLRERYALLWLVTGLTLTALSAWRDGSQHDRRLVRHSQLPAGGAVRGRHPLHPRRAAALLDGDLPALRPERRARAALALLEQELRQGETVSQGLAR